MIKRKLENLITDLLNDFKIIFIAGARQVGKSTLAKYLANKFGFQYISFDDPEIRKTVEAAPDWFLQTSNSKLVIDEVQKIPEIIDYIKLKVDTIQKNGEFILTGSSNIFHNPKIYESLAGRMIITELYPFSTSELKKRNFNLVEILFREDFHKFIKDIKITEMKTAVLEILKGRFPPVFNTDKFSDKWFSAYLEARFNKDLADITEKQLHKASTLKKILKILADRSGNLLNLNNLSKETSLSFQTTKNYLSLLEGLYLIKILPPFFYNITKQVIKQPKVFLIDTGLVSSLLNFPENDLNFLSSDFGKILETHIFLEFKKEISYSKENFQIYFFRDERKNEVDFVIQNRQGNLIAIEVKAKTNIKDTDLKGLRVFNNRFGKHISNLFIFYGGDKIGAVKLANRVVYTIPWRILV